MKVEGGALELTPRDLPDLYAGEPLVLLGKGEALKGKLVVSGTIQGKAWSQSVDLAGAEESPSVARLWASRAIADIEAARWSSQMDDEAADKAIEGLGLDLSSRHHADEPRRGRKGEGAAQGRASDP